MAIIGIAGADWRDVARYDRLHEADRSCFAWEWLRRRTDYHLAFATQIVPATAFGLLQYEDPTKDALDARPFWQAEFLPSILTGSVEPASHSSAHFDLERLARYVSVLATKNGEQILLSNGLKSIRIEIVNGRLSCGPVSTTWELPGLATAVPKMLTLSRLIALAASGTFSQTLHPRERRVTRWTAALRVHDALMAGASHQDLVRMLFGDQFAGPRWRLKSSSWRQRVLRLVQDARLRLDKGPRPWLTD